MGGAAAVAQFGDCAGMDEAVARRVHASSLRAPCAVFAIYKASYLGIDFGLGTATMTHRGPAGSQ